MRKEEEIMSNVKYTYSEDGTTAYGELPDGTVFIIDAEVVDKIKNVKFYLGAKQEGCGQKYLIFDFLLSYVSKLMWSIS